MLVCCQTCQELLSITKEAATWPCSWHVIDLFQCLFFSTFHLRIALRGSSLSDNSIRKIHKENIPGLKMTRTTDKSSPTSKTFSQLISRNSKNAETASASEQNLFSISNSLVCYSWLGRESHKTMRRNTRKTPSWSSMPTITPKPHESFLKVE